MLLMLVDVVGSRRAVDHTEPGYARGGPLTTIEPGTAAASLSA